MGTVRVAGHTLSELDELRDHFADMVTIALHVAATAAASTLSDAVTAAGEPRDLGALSESWQSSLDNTLGPFILETYSSGALAIGYDYVHSTTLPEGQGIPVVSNDFAVKYLADAKNRLKGVGDDLWETARSSLVEGVAAGESHAQLAARVQAAAGLTQGRALTVARTEVMRASNAGSFDQARLISEEGDLKEWVATHDSRVRPEHLETDGQQVPLDDSFHLGPWRLQYPGDDGAPAGETVNCRCTLIYVMSNEPSKTCDCSGALMSAGPITVSADTCVCPNLPGPHSHTESGAALTMIDKNALYETFKKQGPISPAYGGAKIYKHLQGMKDELDAYELDEFEALKVIDEVYAAQGGKSSFADKFDEWLQSAAGKKTTGGLKKSTIYAEHTTPESSTIKPKITVLKPSEIFAIDAQSGDVVAESGENLRIVKSTSNTYLIQKRVGEDSWKVETYVYHPDDITHYNPDVIWHAPESASHTPKPGLKPVVGETKPPIIVTEKPETPATPKDPLDISHVPNQVIADFFDKFKSIKPVTPGWGGSAIYKTLQQAKELVKDDAAYAGLSDAQLLKMLDQRFAALGKGGDKTYLDEVTKWAKTPAGQKATASPGVKSKLTPTTSHSVTPEFSHPGVAGGDISGLDDDFKRKLFHDVKNQGVYLTTSPGDLLKKIDHVRTTHASKYGHLTDLQLLRVLDEQSAIKFGVTNEHLYEKKIVDWLKTPSGKAAAATFNMPAAEKAALAAKKAADHAKKAAEAAKKLVEMIKNGGNTVPPFDASVSSESFTHISVTSAYSMQNQMFTTFGQWTTTQRTALRKYTGSAYQDMNMHLRDGLSVGRSTTNAITEAQRGMRPSTQPILVHRGTNFSQFGVQDAAQARQLVGKTMQDNGFMSTSVGGSAAFGGDVLLEIECPTGTPMAFVKSISKYSRENEMLLAAGTKYRVLSVREGGTKTVVRVRVVP